MKVVKMVGRLAVLGGALVPTVLTAPLAAQQSFSVDDVMSAPFPSALTAAPQGDRVAWVQNDRGARNVWVAEAPDYEGRQVTNYVGDDGQEIGSLQFVSGGDALVFVRGGSPNNAGELPNPTSDPDGVSRAIWRVPIEGGDPIRLADGSAPVVSPDGATLAYLRSGIRVVPVEGGDTRLILNGRGSEGSVRWSPDSERLAFVSGRGDHAFVGVIDVESRNLKWLDTGIDRDGNPVWSPDGSQVAFIRVPYDRDVLPYMAAREALPWSIRIADAATGSGREVWRAPAGSGSGFRSVGGGALWWVQDQLVFPWERTGWLHLYRVGVQGGDAVALTDGGFEVESATLRADEASLLVTSNEATDDPDDLDRRHVWDVPLDGGRRSRAVEGGPGLEWSPVSLEGGQLAFLGASATEPAAAFFQTDDGRRLLDPAGLPSDFPADQLVTPQAVEFPATDGMTIRGQLFLPQDARSGDQRPAVVFFHGGSRRQMLLGFHYLDYYHRAYALNQYMASQGYVVLSVNYRSGVGYGLDFREALDYGARGASEFRDVLGAGLYLQNRDDVDPNAIGLWGGSYGGYLTALGLARASELFAAGVDVHGVHDWNIEFDFDNRTLPDQIDDLAEVKRLAWESSPMSSTDTWRSPVLFIHGDDDRNVPFRETVDLAQKLRKRGVEVEFLSFPDEVHGFLRHDSWVRAYEAAADFFGRRLQRRGVSE
ncbi:MAG: S9 family peptidase [Longimicrobiales bacterium]